MAIDCPDRQAAHAGIRLLGQTLDRRALLKRTVSLLTLPALASFTGCGPSPTGVCAPRSASLARHANPVTAENDKPGDGSWRLSNPAGSREIEGYASAVSVNLGEEISFFVNTAEPSYTLEVFRMGWYGGAGARKMASSVTRAGRLQPTPFPDPETGLIECPWVDPYVLKIVNDANDPNGWASGAHLVKLTAASGKQSYIIFVVRDDARTSDLLFQCSVNTYQAYNRWGGTSLYTTNPRAYKVSFNRPYSRGHGAGDFLQWEYNMVRFLEREGYDVTYSTDVDTHARGDQLLRHAGFLVVGHDEYWSWQMRDSVEAARDQGVGLGFFAANTCFWQVRFEPSLATGDLNRTMVGYKEYALTHDPLATQQDLSQRHLVTGMWRRRPVNRPEDALVGVMYDWDLGAPDTDMVVRNTSTWLFEGTGLADGDPLPGMLGYEADRMFHHAPEGTWRAAHSPVLNAGKTRYADMTVYTTKMCSAVVGTGTFRWSWGLDDFSTGHPVRTNPAVQQITRNILKNFSALPGLPQ
ncbi:MAG: N,N-dimethylformamidase beta subunit family domain-containing protein [Terriglobia bacterium]